ncbi:MAG TPA: nickel-dependent lactate racemase [Pyrinomonadaceae bacterium]|nr:nickel-dependent lactate racemase [Pyrinomonadaceae bacterium]
MKVDFPYEGYERIPPADVPDANLLGVYAPRVVGDVDEERVLARGFVEPHGASRLREALRPTDRVLVLVEDGTRGTPVPRLLKYVAEELSAACVADEQVRLLTAQGTHRSMSEDELRRKLGEFYGRFETHQHDWLDESNLREFGRTRDGTRVTANRLLREADFVLGLGSIVPHRVKGFSGGAKIAFPGVAGREMQERNQWEASRRASEAVMGVAENPMRLRTEEAARMVGLKYIANLVSDADKKIVGCFTGDVVAAHRAGCRLSREINGVRLPRRAGIVLIDSHPADRDFWQSAKGFYSGALAVRDGGTLVVVAPNPEGVADNHPALLEMGYRPHAEVVRMVEAGEVSDIVAAAILADVAQIAERADCILVSPGVTREQTARLGFRFAATVQDALDMAFERQGAVAAVAVLRHGGHILPLVEGEATEARDA